MECLVPDNHFEGPLTLNIHDGYYYCPKHTTKCAQEGCDKVFFDCELSPDFDMSSKCVNHQLYWFNDHAK